MTILRAIQCWLKIHYINYLVVSSTLFEILISRQGQPIQQMIFVFCASCVPWYRVKTSGIDLPFHNLIRKKDGSNNMT